MVAKRKQKIPTDANKPLLCRRDDDQMVKIDDKATPVIKAWWKPTLQPNISSKQREPEKFVTVRFITKQEQYAVPQAPITISDLSVPSNLNKILKEILEKAGYLETVPYFQFLFDNKLITGQLKKHMQLHGLNYEETYNVEYFERYPLPQPKDNLEHDDWVASVMSCNDWLLSGCYDKTIQLWDINRLEVGLGKKAHKLAFSAHRAPVKSVSWVDTNETVKSFVSSSVDQTAMVWHWNCETNQVDCIWECRGHSESIESLKVEPKGTRFATGSWDNLVKVWDADPNSMSGVAAMGDEPNEKKMKNHNGKLKLPIMTLAGHSESVSGVDWVTSNQLLTCSWDHSVRLWDLSVGGMVSQIAGNVSFLCLSYSPINQTLLCGCADRYIRLYDPRSNTGCVVKSKFKSHIKWVSSIKWSPTEEYRFVTGGYDCQTLVWDSRSPTIPLHNFIGHKGKVLSVDWSVPNLIASGSADCQVHVYDMKT